MAILHRHFNPVSESFLWFYFSCAWIQWCESNENMMKKHRKTQKEETITKELPPIEDVNKHSVVDNEFHNTVETILLELE